MRTPIPADVDDALEVWLRVHDELAPGLIEGLYLVGSLALEDWYPGSDIDIVAFTAEPATDADAELLRAAHGAALQETPGAWIDGPRLGWGDVTVAPYTLHRPWTLEGDFHHDAECFEINPITWYVLANRGIPVRGPDPTRLQVVATADDRIRFVRENADVYWRGVAVAVADAAMDPQRTEFDADAIEWCALGAARMLYTFRTGDVTSKSGAGRWLAHILPEYRLLADTALDIRRANGKHPPVERDVAVATAELVGDVVSVLTAPRR